MPSPEDFPALSPHEALERTKFELAELIKILAKRLGLDGKHETATTTIKRHNLGANSILKHGDPYIGHLKDVLAELIRQRDTLAGNGDPNDEHGAPTTTTTTVNGPNLASGNTSAHDDPYIARLQAEQDGLRRERGFGAETLGPADSGHSATTTITNRRGLEAGGSTAEAPEIIVTAPRDDGNEPVSATLNARHHRPGSRGPGACNTFPSIPDDNGRGLLMNAFTGLYNLPHTGSQQHIPEARILPEDDMLAAITNPTTTTTTTTTNERRDIETADLLIDYTTKLLEFMDVQVELDQENERKFLKRLNIVSTTFTISTIVVGIYVGSGFL